MSLGSDKLGKDKALVKDLANGAGFKTDVYATIDELFHDSDEEIVVSTRNKYFAEGAKKFLEDMNFTFLESKTSEPRLVIALLKSEFKFINHMEDQVTIELPYDWDIMENDVRDYVSANPIIKKEERERNESNWDQPLEDQKQKDAIDKVKDWVKEIQKQVSIGSEAAAEMARKHIKKMYHNDNTTSYTATGNPDIKLESGIYNNIEDLIVKNGWKLQFESDYGMSVREYMRDNGENRDVELNLLKEFGFEYISDEILVTPHQYWTNRITEIKYKDQDDDAIEEIVVDVSEFPVPAPPTVRNIPVNAQVVTPTMSVEEEVESRDSMERLLRGDNDTKTEGMGYKNLKSFRNECPIFIVGTEVSGKSSFSLLSDYSSFTLKSGEEEMECETDGFVKIIGLDEFKKYKKEILEGAVSVTLIPNMVGDVEIGAVNSDGNSTTDFNLYDYIYDQIGDDYNVVVKIPEGLEMMELNERTVDIVLRKL